MRCAHVLLPVLVALSFPLNAQEARPIWNVKAVLEDGHTLDIKAFDGAGRQHDVKAIETGDLHLLDVKALDGGAYRPVKVLASADAFAPVKAIGPDGDIWSVKAIGPGGDHWDVKGVARAGNIIHIKAIGPHGALYGVKAISAAGHVHDVKGISLPEGGTDATVDGVAISAHVKALPQTGSGQAALIWHVKAIGTDGHFLDLKVRERNGTLHSVKALYEDGNDQLMDVKAFVNGQRLDVKVLESSDELLPVKAIGADGKVHDIKALMADGTVLDVKAVARDGAILHIKAIAPDGKQLGVKAIGPGGQLRDVKGLKFREGTELTLHGVPVLAHIKALPQVY